MKQLIVFLAFFATLSLSACLNSDANAPRPEMQERKVHHVNFDDEGVVRFVNVQFADPSPAPETTLSPADVGAAGFAGWIASHWADLIGILVGLYELIVRFFPTVKSYSIVSWIMRLLIYILPDRTKDGRQFVGEKKV